VSQYALPASFNNCGKCIYDLGIGPSLQIPVIKGL